MNKIFASALMAVAMMGSVSEADACTNFIVGKKASVDGSVMCSYSADDYGMFQNLAHILRASMPRARCARFLTGIPMFIMEKFLRLPRPTVLSVISTNIR